MSDLNDLVREIVRDELGALLGGTTASEKDLVVSLHQAGVPENIREIIRACVIAEIRGAIGDIKAHLAGLDDQMKHHDKLYGNLSKAHDGLVFGLKEAIEGGHLP